MMSIWKKPYNIKEKLISTSFDYYPSLQGSALDISTTTKKNIYKSVALH